MDATRSSTSLMPYMLQNIPRSIPILNDIIPSGNRWWYPSGHHLNYGLSSRKLGRLVMIVHQNWYTACVSGDDGEGVYEILVRQTTVHALLRRDVSYLLGEESGEGENKPRKTPR